MSYIQTDMTQREVELNTLVTRYREALEFISKNISNISCDRKYAARVATNALSINQPEEDNHVIHESR